MFVKAERQLIAQTCTTMLHRTVLSIDMVHAAATSIRSSDDKLQTDVKDDAAHKSERQLVFRYWNNPATTQSSSSFVAMHSHLLARFRNNFKWYYFIWLGCVVYFSVARNAHFRLTWPNWADGMEWRFGATCTAGEMRAGTPHSFSTLITFHLEFPHLQCDQRKKCTARHFIHLHQYAGGRAHNFLFMFIQRHFLIECKI